MRKLILAAALGVVGLSAMPAEAQYRNYGHYNSSYRHDFRDARQDCRRAMRRADTRWEYRRAQRFCQRQFQEARRERYWDGGHWRYR